MGKTGIGVGHANTRCTLTGRGNSRREMQLTSSCQVSEPSSTPRPHLLINILSKHFFRAEFYNDLSKSKIKEKIVIWMFKYFEEITPFRSVEHGGGFTEMVQSGIHISIVVLWFKVLYVKGIRILLRAKPSYENFALLPAPWAKLPQHHVLFLKTLIIL